MLNFIENDGYIPVFGTTADTSPQLQFVENMPMRAANAFVAIAYSTLSFHAVIVTQNVSFNHVLVAFSNSNVGAARTNTVSFGLYSLTGSTLTLLNSASGAADFILNETGQEWVDMTTSASSNITPGQYYFGINLASVISTVSILGGSSINIGNAIPGQLLMGRMTATTNAMPASVATTDLDVTGNDATRQPYIIITA